MSSSSSARRDFVMDTTRPDCCTAQLAVCCGPRACRLCCRCCPPARESISTKLIYIMLLVVANSFMIAMLIPSMQGSLQNIFRDFNATCIDFRIATADYCSKLTGYMAVYKISFPITLFFIFMGIFTLRADSSKHFTAWIHNGFWFFKLVVISTMVIASFVVPISHFDQLHSFWIYMTLGGNCCFMLIQMICILEASSRVNDWLRNKIERNPPLWTVIETLIVFGILFIWLSLVIGLFFIHGRQDYCLTKHVLIIFNTGLCATIMFASLTPCARRPLLSPGSSTPRYFLCFGDGRLLQSGLISLYIIYWTWSALQSTPSDIAGVVELYFLLDKDERIMCDITHNNHINNILLFISMTSMVLTIIYLCTINRESEAKQPDVVQQDNNNGDIISLAVENDGGQRIIRNELFKTSYNYSLFHFSMALSIMFTTAQLTKWFTPNEYLNDFDKSWRTVTVKAICSWLCGILYLLFLLLPFPIFSNRNIRNVGEPGQTSAPTTTRATTNVIVRNGRRRAGRSSLVVLERNEINMINATNGATSNQHLITTHM